MRIIKRFLAMMLVLCMIFGMVPMSAFAEENSDAAETIVDDMADDSGVDDDFQEEVEEQPVEDVEPEKVEEQPVEDVEPEKVEEQPVEDVEPEKVEEQPVEDVEPEKVEEQPVEDAEPEDSSQKEETVLVEPKRKLYVNRSKNAVEPQPTAVAAEFDEFIRAFALDCGRLYFTVDQIKTIIDEMALYDYTHLTLAFGNSGFRFLLDDMTIGNYSSNAVKDAILEGNTAYVANDGHNGSSAPNTCLTEDDMDSIIAYANSKDIEIIPALNSPGHMNTIVYAMGTLGIQNAGYPVDNSYNSESTININNAQVNVFVSALIQKYIEYFDEKGCTMFNLGADEFANDPTDDKKLSGFSGMSTELKNSFISYVNGVANMISSAGMIPMMFNDGYAWKDANFNEDIVVCYWTNSGVESTIIANAGHKIINNSKDFYYVLGSPFGEAESSWCSYASAMKGVTGTSVTTLIDGGNVGNNLIGAQMFLWCDYTDEVYTEGEEGEEGKVLTLIRTLAENNPNYFTNLPETKSVIVKVNESLTDIIDGKAYTEAKIADSSIVSVNLTTPATQELYKAASDTEASTTVEFTGLKAGTTQVTVGHVTYNVTVDDGLGQRETRVITVPVGQTSGEYIHDGSDGITQNPDQNIAKMNVDSGDPEGVIGEAVDSVIDGKYVIYTYRGKYLTNKPDSNKLAMDQTEYTVWNFKKVSDGKYYITDNNDNYLTVDNGTAGVTSDRSEVTLVYGTSTDKDNATGFFIKQNGLNLNNGQDNTHAGGTTGTGSWSRWQIKPYSEVPSTEKISFTGVSAGTTYATIGNVDYVINVLGNEVTETREITLRVNQTLTDRIMNGQADGQIETAEPSIATGTAALYNIAAGHELVKVQDLSDIDSGEKYVLVNKRSGKVLGYEVKDNGLVQEDAPASVESTTWTIRKNVNSYLLMNVSEKYMTIGNRTAGLNNYPYNSGLTFHDYKDGTFAIARSSYYLNDWNGQGQVAAGYSYLDDEGNHWEIYAIGETASENGTDVSFTGHSVGTTYAMVGGVYYIIHVLEEDISQVSLTYHSWISTYSVHPEGTVKDNCYLGARAFANHISATEPDVHSVQGAVVSRFVAPTGNWYYEGEAQTVYWKATVLPEGKHQENVTSKDHSMSGTDFKYIRYWKGEWAYSSNRTIWIKVKQTDEVCAYYLQKTNVTTEVDTYVKDWAYTSKNAHDAQNDVEQKALSFAVVYPDGTINPTEKDIYEESTLIYYENLANLGFIRIAATDIYEVEKITYTLGERAGDNNSQKWNTNESITWDKKPIDDKEWYNETVCWDESYGTEPVINGEDIIDKVYPDNTETQESNDGTWGANDAVLILIYLKPIATEDSLKVVYYDERFNEELHFYHINVNSDVTFANLSPEPERFNGNASRIDVSNCKIVNSKDVTLSIKTDLTAIPSVFGKYPKELYTYTGSEISDDEKTLYLYYNVNTEVLNPNFVVDFGLPVSFALSDITNVPDDVANVTVSAKYGEVIYKDGKFTYTPSRILQDTDMISVGLEFSDTKAGISTTYVGITPATTVYYEEDFLLNESSTKWGYTRGNALENQCTEELGERATNPQVNNYGYDPAYANLTDKKSYIEGKPGASTSFTFTGTGFQLYGNSKTGSGYVTVYSQGRLNKLYMINTQLNGLNTAEAKDGYDSLPFISETALPHGTYTVRIKQTNGNDAIYLDGVRIINTIDDKRTGADNIYFNDKEDNPAFYELRDYVLNAIGVEKLTASDYITQNDRVGLVKAVKDLAGQVYSALGDGEKAIVINQDGTTFTTEQAQKLLDEGPKNELYLYPGQTLLFNVTTDRVMQLGMKSPTGSAKFELEVDGNTVEPNSISSTVDMFYEIAEKSNTTGKTHIVSIQVTEGVLSVTNLKICDDPYVAFNSLSETDIEQTLMSMFYEFPEDSKKPENNSKPDSSTKGDSEKSDSSTTAGTKEELQDTQNSVTPSNKEETVTIPEVVKPAETVTGPEVVKPAETITKPETAKPTETSPEETTTKEPVIDEVAKVEDSEEKDVDVEKEEIEVSIPEVETEAKVQNPVGLIIGIAAVIAAAAFVFIFGFKKKSKKK